LLDGRPAVLRFSDNQDIGLVFQQGTDPIPQHGVIVGEENPDIPGESQGAAS
jgi:hypothetical protein